MEKLAPPLPFLRRQESLLHEAQTLLGEILQSCGFAAKRFLPTQEWKYGETRPTPPLPFLRRQESLLREAQTFLGEILQSCGFAAKRFLPTQEWKYRETRPTPRFHSCEGRNLFCAKRKPFWVKSPKVAVSPQRDSCLRRNGSMGTGMEVGGEWKYGGLRDVFGQIAPSRVLAGD